MLGFWGWAHEALGLILGAVGEGKAALGLESSVRQLGAQHALVAGRRRSANGGHTPMPLNPHCSGHPGGGQMPPIPVLVCRGTFAGS